MNKLIYDCIIIGSGPAALTAALYMKRAGYLTHVITGEKVGGTLPLINNIENYPGFIEINGLDLSNKLIEQCTNLDIEFTYFTNVNHFYRIGYSNEHKNIKQSDIFYKIYAIFLTDENNYKKADFYSKSVILATGTSAKTLGLPNEYQYFGHGIHTCATCDGTFYKNKDIFVIGGGNTAFSYALYLSQLCKSVTIIHRRSEYRAEKYLIDKCKEKVNIYYLTNTIIESLIGDNKKLISTILLSNNKHIVKNIDGIFYALGSNNIFVPYVDFGEDSKVFVSGDCALNPEYHQIIIAAGNGASTAIDCIKSLK